MIEAISNLAKTAASAASTVNPAMQQLELFKAAFNLISAAFNMATKNATSQLSSEAGMPKFIKDGVNDAADKACGGCQKETSAAATEQVAGASGDAKSKMTESLSKQIVDNVKAEREESEKKTNGQSGGNGKSGWLLALAKAFGKVADAAAAELKQKGENIDKENPSSMLEYQALTQEFNLMMQTFTNAIKTIGEAEGQAVRKG
jgi:Type III secretion needle MxiH, YscF, SsaG, EprI, PscF, EscF